jgi:hypothetical protein
MYFIGSAWLILFDSQMSATLWDLLGMALWGSLIASIVLTFVGLRLWSPWPLLIAVVLSLVFNVPGSIIFGRWVLLLSITQAALAIIVAFSRTRVRVKQ